MRKFVSDALTMLSKPQQLVGLTQQSNIEVGWWWTRLDIFLL